MRVLMVCAHLHLGKWKPWGITLSLSYCTSVVGMLCLRLKKKRKANSRDCTFMKVFPVSSWLCWTTRASLPTSTFRVRWSCWRCGLVCCAVALIVITGGNRGARRGMLLCTWGLRMNVWGIHRSWAMNSCIFFLLFLIIFTVSSYACCLSGILWLTVHPSASRTLHLNHVFTFIPFPQPMNTPFPVKSHSLKQCSLTHLVSSYSLISYIFSIIYISFPLLSRHLPLWPFVCAYIYIF